MFDCSASGLGSVREQGKARGKDEDHTSECIGERLGAQDAEINGIMHK